MKAFITNKKTLFILGTIFILLLWEVLSLAFDRNSMIFPSPISTFNAMGDLLKRSSTYSYLLNSVLKTVMGFVISFILSLLLGIIAGHNGSFYQFLKPLINVIKSIPTVAFVYLFLIIFQPKNSPIYVVVLVSFPILYESIVAGINKTDPIIIQAAKVDGANKITQILRMRLPLAIPYILVGISSSLAMSFKVEIMAEVLTGMTKGGIGAAIGALQGSESNLSYVFGYTLIIVIFVLLFTYISEHFKKVFIQ